MKEKVLVIPDSFKGSMSSKEVCDILCDVIQKHTSAEAIGIPIADGGEGTTECIRDALGGEMVKVHVHSPENKMIEAHFAILPTGASVLEIAESSGLTKQTSFHALDATTYGFGEMIKEALDRGVREFLLGLGGSATTDCACGMAAALGVEFLDESGQAFVPTGGTLKCVKEIRKERMDERIKESHFVVMSDVANPLYGSQGAAFIYAPQKGASPDEVCLLDEGLRHISLLVKDTFHLDCGEVIGAGAAGGAGYGCAAFLNATLKSGIHGMLDICHFDELVRDASLVVTGEGKLDKQSMMGKVLSGILERAGGKHIVSFCGVTTLSKEEREQMGVSIVEIGEDVPVEESVRNAKQLLHEKAVRFFANQG